MIYLLSDTAVTQTAIIHPLASDLCCLKVKTEDDLEGWM